MKSALVKSEDKKIVEYKTTITPIIETATGIIIQGPVDMEIAVETLSKLNQFNDRITEEKETITKPANEILKRERARWKPLETLYEGAIAILRAKMTAYQTAEKKRAQDEADRIAARVGEGKGKLKVETAIKKIEVIDKPEGKVATDSGSVRFKTVKKFEVMDVTLLPKEFLLPDEVAIRKAMVEGKELPGVRYYEEEQVINSR